MTLATEDGQPNYGNIQMVPVEPFKECWIPHPERDVDLAVFPLAPILHWMQSQRKTAFYKSITHELLLPQEELEELSAIEEVTMIGYPNGLWDEANNLPIVRRGITATPPYVNFNGKSEFVIDRACFPGSSGSPVYLHNMGSFMRKAGGINLGSRVKLLGILWGGPQYVAPGEIKVLPVPTINRAIALSQIPNNLGYCVNASKLLVFETEFARYLTAQERVNEGAEIGQGGCRGLHINDDYTGKFTE